MAKRYYTCKIIGDGQTPETAWRPAIADITDPGQGGVKAFSFAVQMPPSDPGTGAPTRDHCLVVATGRNHALVRNHPDIDPLFDAALDVVRMSALQEAERIAIFNRLQSRGLNTAALANADAARDVIDNIGKQINPVFDVLNFDVSE